MVGRKLLAGAGLLAVLALLAWPSASAASYDPSGAPFDEDFVTGTHVSPEFCGVPCFHVVTSFDAHSGPSGEHPTGSVRVDVQFDYGTEPFDSGEVTCLNVSGNRATIGVDLGVGVVFAVEDNDGAGQDRLSVSVGGEAPSICPAVPSIGLSPIFGGDITVHDAVPFPTSKDQCKNGGWDGFGFKNQGRCISFVEAGPKP
jgi:hypothetical protein